MKAIFFDAGPIISLTMNNLLWLLDALKKRFNGKFYITPAIKRELVDKPMKTKRFKFEAMQIMKLIDDGVLEILEDGLLNKRTKELIDLANQSFKARGTWIKMLHTGEVETIAAAVDYGGEAAVIDERAMRVIIEKPDELKKLMMRKLHTKVIANERNLREFSKIVQDVKVIRSIELVTRAFELGLLDKYLPKKAKSKKELLDAVLWGVKIDGCSVSKQEIEEILRLEKS